MDKETADRLINDVVIVRLSKANIRAVLVSAGLINCRCVSLEGHAFTVPLEAVSEIQ